jgi:hypothetical protein
VKNELAHVRARLDLEWLSTGSKQVKLVVLGEWGRLAVAMVVVAMVAALWRRRRW